jgi:hypothetical protein
MYSNKQLKALLQSKKKRASALKNRAMKGGGNKGALKAYNDDLIQLGYEIQNAKDENKHRLVVNLQNKKNKLQKKISRIKRGGNVQSKYGRKRNKVMVGNNTQKIFPGVYNANKPLQSHTPVNLRGGQYSLPVGDIISNEQHRGIVNAQNKLVSAWRRRNNYVKF